MESKPKEQLTPPPRLITGQTLIPQPRGPAHPLRPATHRRREKICSEYASGTRNPGR